MKHLLDVNLLLALAWESHIHHATADAWLSGKQIVLCPITELGFIRISTHKKVMAVSMADARKALEKFIAENKACKIPADLDALDSHPADSDEVTDHYLADLAAKHGLKLATFDGDLNHASVELVK
jgi:hypothetical protein